MSIPCNCCPTEITRCRYDYIACTAAPTIVQGSTTSPVPNQSVVVANPNGFGIQNIAATADGNTAGGSYGGITTRLVLRWATKRVSNCLVARSLCEGRQPATQKETSLVSNTLLPLPAYAEGAQQRFILDWYHRVGPCGNSDLGINGLLCAYDQATGQPADQSANAGASADGNASTLAGACADECQCPGRVKRGLPCRADCPKRVGS